MLNVENKVAIVTGASSGIGEATARLLAKNGAKVIQWDRTIDVNFKQRRIYVKNSPLSSTGH